MSDKSLEDLSIEELFALMSIKPGSSLSKIALQLKEYEVDGSVLADNADNLDELLAELEITTKAGPKLAYWKNCEVMYHYKLTLQEMVLV